MSSAGLDDGKVLLGQLDRGRKAFERHAWAAAFNELTAAGLHSPLEVDDLERLAICAHLMGRIDESVASWEGAHRACSRKGDPTRAVRCAFWLAFVLLNHGELTRGGGWILRAQRLLSEAQIDCVEHGYLRYCASLRLALVGDVEGAAAGFAEAATIGDRFQTMELMALARVGQGRCLIGSGHTASGLELLDEAMAAATTSEVSPTAMGDMYCTVIEGCQEVFDVRRAQEWTEALSRWCDSQPELVLYRGQCLIHRAELMLIGGQWANALAEVQRACARLARPRSQPALGAAYYVRGELHRLRGEFPEAEAAFAQAGVWGRPAQPGLALLRLAQGRVDEADTAMRRTLEVAKDDISARSRLLGPFVETALAAGDLAAARSAADELSSIASAWNTPYINAVSEHAVGAVLLAEGDPRAALGMLRRAWAGWADLEAPHEAARARLLIGQACRELRDEEGAAVELNAARFELERIGASIAPVRVLEQTPALVSPDHDGLTPRELEVLRLVATGTTNRAIAAVLFISEKTVASHVGSILHKLGLQSRAAATAYAHRRRLV